MENCLQQRPRFGGIEVALNPKPFTTLNPKPKPLNPGLGALEVGGFRACMDLGSFGGLRFLLGPKGLT